MARTTVLVLFIALVTAGAADAAEAEIVIGPRSLDPPVLEVRAGQRVIFVNRSGRRVHVDFVGDAKQHHVFHVPETIWAIFHRSGRHPYVVHFETGDVAPLRGLVEVAVAPSPLEGPLTCSSITVMELCMEP